MRILLLSMLLPALLFACKSEPPAPAPAKKEAPANAKKELSLRDVPNITPKKAEPTPTNEAGQIEVRADAKGFSPNRIWVEKGKPVKLLFTRVVEKTCMDGVVFPSLGIKKDLEVGEPVEVEFTPEESGEIAFHCPMGHGKSSVVVLTSSSSN